MSTDIYDDFAKDMARYIRDRVIPFEQQKRTGEKGHAHSVAGAVADFQRLVGKFKAIEGADVAEAAAACIVWTSNDKRLASLVDDKFEGRVSEVMASIANTIPPSIPAPVRDDGTQPRAEMPYPGGVDFYFD